MGKKPFRPTIAVLLGIALLSGAGACNSPSDRDVRKTFRHRDYAGSRDREYLVHLPGGYDPAARPLPLVMVLHGCHQDHETIRHDTDFDRVADRGGFLVVYPFITGFGGPPEKKFWGFLMDDQIHEGPGEAQHLHTLIECDPRD